MDVVIDAHPITSDFDLYTHSVHGNIVVTEKVKRDLETLFPGQMAFTSAQHLQIKMDDAIYQQKMSKPLPVLDIQPLDARIGTQAEFFLQKMERLKETTVVLPSSDEEDEFSEIEEKLQVRFPASFKEVYREGQLAGNYEFRPIPLFHRADEYSDEHPETYKGVLVAGNGMGDSMGLILERNSDYKLKATLYEFLHEGGDYRKLIDF